jgi:hypothetical protein
MAGTIARRGHHSSSSLLIAPQSVRRNSEAYCARDGAADYGFA